MDIPDDKNISHNVLLDILQNICVADSLEVNKK